MVSYGLKDRVALITGANNPQGIGATPSVRIFLLYNKRLQELLQALDAERTRLYANISSFITCSKSAIYNLL